MPEKTTPKRATRRPAASADKPPNLDAAAQAVAKAVREEPGIGQGRVMKVLYLDDQGNPIGEWASQQLPENPFTGQMQGLQEPPFRLEQLVYLAESHPVHSAALEQKTADIVGRGWEWEPVDEQEAPEEQRDEMAEWFESLAPDEFDMREVINAVWLDVETTGWGLFEVARDPSGVAQRIYHVPAHTVRAHRAGFKLAQIRDARKVWFRRWGAVEVDGAPVEVDSRTGSTSSVKIPANDLFIIKRPARRSTWYGIPGYVSSVGWIALALAVRDDNLFFFANRREPRWAIILNNIADDPNLEEDIRRAFTVDLRQPHRNILIPIQGNGTIEFQQLSGKAPQEGSFEKLGDRADAAIMVSHRVPAERLANTKTGPLGGNVAEWANRVYKEGVVGPGQELLASRLNRFISVEYAIATGANGTRQAKTQKAKLKKAQAWKPAWFIQMDDLDIETDREELDLAVIAFHGDLITLREARNRLKLGPLMVPKQVPMVDEQGNPLLDPATGEPMVGPDTGTIDPATGDVIAPEMVESPYNDKLFTELPGAAAQAGQPGAVPTGSGGLLHNARGDGHDPAMALLLAETRESLEASRNIESRIAELATREE